MCVDEHGSVTSRSHIVHHETSDFTGFISRWTAVEKVLLWKKIYDIFRPEEKNKTISNTTWRGLRVAMAVVYIDDTCGCVRWCFELHAVKFGTEHIEMIL